MVKQLMPKASYQRLEANKNAVLIDVRSQAECKFVGHPPMALWIPWADDPHWLPAPQEFVGAVNDALGENAAHTEILLICRSGQRSNSAAQCLVSHGFTNVANVVNGFEGELDEHKHRSSKSGWRYDGLPWEQG